MTARGGGLARERCRPCGPRVAPLKLEDAARLLTQIPDWTLEQPARQPPRLRRTFEFDDYRQAANFAFLLARRSDEANHHPEIRLEFGRAAVLWWTHNQDCLDRNDFIMAAVTDEVYRAGKWLKLK